MVVTEVVLLIAGVELEIVIMIEAAAASFVDSTAVPGLVVILEPDPSTLISSSQALLYSIDFA